MAAAVVGGEVVNVSAFCRDHGVSRDTFYRWRRRFTGNLDDLEPRSTAPKSSPQRTPVEVEDAVVALRKQLDEDGLDAGASTIQFHLGRRGVHAVPSVATIWRILVRRGFVTPQPKKRPKSVLRRFEAAAPNELWQADATKVTIGIGQVEILVFLDDHSRVVTGCRAVLTATTENTWDAFCAAVQTWGLPAGHLSDNGLNFSGRLRGIEVGFETNLRAAGVRPITSRPFHPQTCGKVERFHQTLKKWLRRQPLAADIAALQAQLDWFIAYYNTQRPHRGIGRTIPIDRWSASPKVVNLGDVIARSQQRAASTVDRQGRAKAGGWLIQVGVNRSGQHADVLFDDTHAAVFIDGHLVRHLELDHSRPYQPNGRAGNRRT
jgi:transposase InsO family protein